MERCLHLVGQALPPTVTGAVDPDPAALAALRALDASGAAAPCTAVLLADLTSPSAATATGRVAMARRAVAAAPATPEGWQLLATALVAAGRPADAADELRRALAGRWDPVDRMGLAGTLADVLAGAGDVRGADSLVATVRDAAERDGRPGVRIAFLVSGTALAGRAGLPADPDSLRRIAAAIAHAVDQPATECIILLPVSHRRLDAGDPAAALPLAQYLTTLADRTGSPSLRLMAWTALGRTYAKLGRLAEAHRALETAIAAGADDRYYEAEAWHNLAHVYEGEGRFPAAARAAARFVTLTGSMPRDALRAVSLRDAATIAWKAGWHAAADSLFRRMVQVVNEERENQYWAGDYLERRGDLTGAVADYRASIAAGTEVVESWRGLTSAWTALGDDDSAAAAARAHDRLQADWPPLETPLWPVILARRGEGAGAVATSRAWADRQVAAGNVEGAAIALEQLASLLLDRGDATEALAAAAQADSLTGALELTAQRITAAILEGRALLGLGRTAEGERRLAAAAALARRHPSPDATLQAETALGDALGAMGQRPQALAAYARAAAAAEAVAGVLPADLPRAGYLARHLAPYDHAIRTLLTGPVDAGTLDALERWSERRKGTGLALDIRTGRAAPAVRSLWELQRRLGPHEVLIDYLVADSVAAIALTRRQAALVRLPVSAETLAGQVAGLTRGYDEVFGGRVDVAATRFDSLLARRLFAELLAPLGRLVGPATRLVIAPDGALHDLAFAALLEGDRPLVDRVTVAYLPSAQFLGVSARTDYRRARTLVVAYDAPGADAEAAAIEGIWPVGHIAVLAGAAATERAVRAARGYAIVHFATHAEANADDPLASHLQLAPDARDDGLYHPGEIAAGRSATLVVLAACASLRGRRYPGAGLIGLARAFLAAGAHDVVATRWPVGAASAPLMAQFYRGLARGLDPADALSDAQRILRRDPRYRSPFFWAGYAVMGE